MPTKAKSIFTQLISGFSICIILCLITLYRNQKQKNQFQHLTGKISALTKSIEIEGYSSSDGEQFRYLQIQDYLPIFRLSITEDIDGSKPTFELVDQLKAGDTVTVYYDENHLNNNSNTVSNLAYFIDKGQKPYFIRGSQNNMGYYLLCFCIIGCIVTAILKKTGRIN